MSSFVAIDVETATRNRNSICAIGIVAVNEDTIIEKRWMLIKPPGNEYENYQISIHKITPEMTESAPEFPDVYPELKQYLNSNSVVCHNATFDMDAISQTMYHYNIHEDLNIDCNCTLNIFGSTLNECCYKYGIPLNHHDPLSDAEACAKLFLIYKQGKIHQSINEELSISKRGFAPKDNRQNIKSEFLKPDFDNVENTDNPFYGKKIVISGTYENWPDRNDLAKILRDLGGDIDATVTKRTNILCAGKGLGPAKFQTMMRNIEEGKDAKIISENEIIEMLKEIDMC